VKVVNTLRTYQLRMSQPLSRVGFLSDAMQLRRERIEEETQTLQRLPDRRLESYSKESLKVSGNSVINIRDNHYSVPTQLIGERVEVRIYAEQVEVWYAGELIERMERLRGEGKVAINYRHLIHSLVKKPRAFAHY
jgi:hypothetical protein